MICNTDTNKIAIAFLFSFRVLSSTNIACLFKNTNTNSAINTPSHAALVLVRINPPILRMQQINMSNLVLSDFSIKSDMMDAGTV